MEVKVCNEINGHFERNILTNVNNNGTKKYGHIKTENVVNFFTTKGWTKVATSAKNPNKQCDKQYHKVVLEHKGFKMPQGNPRLIIGNSYNLKKPLEISLGFFNFTCANGIIAGENLYSFKKKHRGKINLDEILENEYNKIAAKLTTLESEINRMSKAILTPKEKFKRSYRALRVAEFNLKDRTVDFRELLRPLREEEKEDNIWNVLNIVQEKMIRTGVKTIQGRKISKLRGNLRRIEGNKAVWTAFAA